MGADTSARNRKQRRSIDGLAAHSAVSLHCEAANARKRTRTSTGLPPLGPEPSASTNSAIRANFEVDTCCLAAEHYRAHCAQRCERAMQGRSCPEQDSNLH